ncbi:MAG TPA: hypothetical protein VLS89_06695 [Candidatus Nanopelagicales bacterium]|nr:hypothetical protein [Candidatus Nanopelagicales bacterium]
MRLSFFLALLLAGCPRQGEQPLVTPVVPDTDWCREAEIRLEALACKDPRGEPMWVNRRGERFAETCRVTQKEGGVFLNPRCIAQVEACSEVDACAQRP